MKLIFVLMASLYSLPTFAAQCSASIRQFKALEAAMQIEKASGENVALATEFMPMNAHDVYTIRFSYPEFQRAWRVHIDDSTCEVISVVRAGI